MTFWALMRMPFADAYSLYRLVRIMRAIQRLTRAMADFARAQREAADVLERMVGG